MTFDIFIETKAVANDCNKLLCTYYCLIVLRGLYYAILVYIFYSYSGRSNIFDY